MAHKIDEQPTDGIVNVLFEVTIEQQSFLH